MNTAPDRAIPTPAEAAAALDMLLRQYVTALIAADSAANSPPTGRLGYLGRLGWLKRKRAELTRYYTQSSISIHLLDMQRAYARLVVLPEFIQDGATELARTVRRCRDLGATLQHRPGLATLASARLPGLSITGVVAAVAWIVHQSGLTVSSRAFDTAVTQVGYIAAVAVTAFLVAAGAAGTWAYHAKRDLFTRLRVDAAERIAYRHGMLCSVPSLKRIPSHLIAIAIGGIGFDAAAAVIEHLWFNARWGYVLPAVLGLALAGCFRWQWKTLHHVHREMDSLTGLGSWKAFHQQASALAGHGQAATIVMFDLDQMKPVNDRCGHPTGDAVLAEVGARIEETVLPGHPAALVARIGGDEYALILPGCDLTRAGELVEAVRRAVGRLIQVGSHEIRITLSAGIAALEGDAEAAYRAAELELTRSKGA